jgi:hypothetical protein
MMAEKALCELCGEPLPQGEEMFKFHGYSGNCPKPPLHRNVPARSVPAWIAAAAKECSDRVLVGEGEKAFTEIITRHYQERGER